MPWKDSEEYTRWSPDTYLHAWDTPTLVIHGGVDYRVVDTEGIATFTALQRRGVESKLLFFPDENHWILKGENSRFWFSEVHAWLARWLK